MSAFGSFGNPGGGGGGGAASNANSGPDLELVQTERLGFHSLAADARVRLTSPWSPRPDSTASLLSIASKKGLVAAAGPDAVSIATTDSVRKAFSQPAEGDSPVRSMNPELKLPLPIRICQLTFTSDEDYLIMSAEQGGGLAVHQVQALMQGSTQPAFQIPTNNESVRALAPNPSSEKAELCAVVTSQGKLLMANMKERNFAPGQNGQVLREQVSCVSWSNRGKQLIAGLGDGTVVQMTPEGVTKAEIPRPPGLGDSFFVEMLSWLENDLFFVVYISTSQGLETTCHLITRSKDGAFTFQKLNDPVDPFGSDRTPHYTAVRLRDFPPNLQDLLVFSSTAISDIGIISRSKNPLTTDISAEKASKVSGVFTNTEIADDSRRAILPMGEDTEDRIPIGTALDLSSKDNVYRPIPSDETDQSPGPLPGYWVLNEEGVLCAWWIVYDESIRGGTTYPGLVAAESNTATSSAPAAPAAQPANPSPFGNAGGSAFGASSTPAAAPAFGSSTALGAKPSPWGAQGSSTTGGATFGSSTFGSAPARPAPAFGQSAFGQSSFGQPSTLGAKSSPWATNASSTGGGSPFGQVANSTGQTGGAFGSGGTFGSNAGGSGGGFASFANKGGFGQVASDTNKEGASIFASAKTSAPEVSMDAETSFPPPAKTEGSSAFGSQPFKLQSSFQRDPNATDDNTDAKPTSSLFGSTFGSALGEAAKTAAPSPFAPKTDEAPKTQAPNPFAAPKPAETPAEQKPNPFAAPKPAETPNPFAAKASDTPPSQKPNPFASPKPAETPASQKPNPFASPKPAETPASPKPNPFASPKPDETPKAPAPNPFASAFSKPEDKATTPQKSLFAKAGDTQSPNKSLFAPASAQESESTTPTTTPAPSRFLSSGLSSTPGTNIFGSAKPREGLFGSKTPKAAPPEAEAATPENKGPDVPLPPESTSKDTYPLGESSSSSATTADLPENNPPRADSPPTVVEDAPLPPDPTSSKNKKFYQREPEAPTPADPPLPPDPAKHKELYSVPLPPLPGQTNGSKPAAKPQKAPEQPKKAAEQPKKISSLFSNPAPKPAGSLFVFPSNPPPVSDSEEDEDDWEDQETNEGSEGSGVDVAKDLSPPGSQSKTPVFSPESSFGGPGASKPSLSLADPGRRTLFGEVSRNAPALPQPNIVSPRSPSPVRGAVPSRLAGGEHRSFSTPAMASQLLGQSKPQPSLQSSIVGKAQTPIEEHIMEQRRKVEAQKKDEESRLLVDEEDDAIQRILDSAIQPSLKLDEFIAHSRVVDAAGDSIPEQVEAVYRDINTMIDTLGLNSRSMKAFVQGQGTLSSDAGQRSKEDLASAEGWTLAQIQGLSHIIEDDLGQALEDAKVKNVERKLAECSELQRELVRERNKQADLKKMIATRADPDQAMANRALPLSAEQAAQQNDLRREFAKFTRQLAEVEESLTLLKAKIVSNSNAHGKPGGQPTPTIEAVVRTITKMTGMVEKRSGDIDVLENQMRKLRMNSSTPGPRSREGSPFATPSKSNRNSVAIFSPERSMRESTPSRNSVMRHSLSNSLGGAAGFPRTPPRKKISGFGDVEKEAVKEKRQRRAAVLGKLRDSLQKKGPSVWTVDDN